VSHWHPATPKQIFKNWFVYILLGLYKTGCIFHVGGAFSNPVIILGFHKRQSFVLLIFDLLGLEK
jgi:hypothetical protein